MIPLKDDHVAFHYYNIWLNDKQDNNGVFRILFHNHVCCDIGICPIYKKALSNFHSSVYNRLFHPNIQGDRMF